MGHLSEIDLQDNLIWKWAEVARFSIHIPALTSMLLHGNKMQEVTPSVVEGLAPRSFSSLRVLALNGCGIKSWQSFSLLLPFLSNIEELYLSSNLLDDLPVYLSADESEESQPDREGDDVFSTNDAFLPALRILDISGCGVTDWNQILTFGGLPKLEDLRVDDNPLPRIVAPPANSQFFSNLIRLSISSTQISSWSCVDSLNGYPSCTHLRLSHIPLFSGRGASEVRPIVIGRVPALRFFNGSGVGQKERYDSEKSYLRRVMRLDNYACSLFTWNHLLKLLSAILSIREVNDLENSISTPSAEEIEEVISNLHPRYAELREKYASELLPMGAAANGADPGTIAAGAIPFSFSVLAL